MHNNDGERKLAAQKFYELMNERRTIRHFDEREVPLEIILDCVKTAGTAPSGANKQPWFFAVVKDVELKKKIRAAAEKEEFDFYNKRADEKFLSDLAPFKTNWQKPHLEEASALIVIFSKSYEVKNGDKDRSYYPTESVGIATGILITALHRLGLATLTHTPNPMRFLTQILGRPKGERPFLILAVGHKRRDCVIPKISRKELSDIAKVY